MQITGTEFNQPSTAPEAASARASDASTITHLQYLEAEAIFVLREVAVEFERPVLLFSGGKDSIVASHLARKGFFPGPVPFPLLHVDTGHNVPETIEYRDWTIGDMTCTGAVVSEASSVAEIIKDIAGASASERGTRADDQRSAAAMEDRKREGYF